MKSRNKQEICDFFKLKIAEEMQMDIMEIDIHQNFAQFRLDSINSLFILEQLENYLGISINPLDFWNYPTIGEFSQHIIDDLSKSGQLS